MKASVIVFPGSNCDRDIQVALRNSIGGPVHMVWHGDSEMAKTDLIVLPGGFSYGDYLRCGAMSARSPIMREVVARAESGVAHLMLGRGLIARPDLARQIRAAAEGRALTPLAWPELIAMISRYWQAIRAEVPERHAPGRLKQWVFALSRHYPEAQAFFLEIRRGRECASLDAAVASQLAATHSSAARGSRVAA